MHSSTLRAALICAALLAVTCGVGPAAALDPGKTARYPSPDLYRPEMDSLIIHDGGASRGPVDGMSVAGRTLAARAQDLLNVRDFPFGAKCDGAADDTAAFGRLFAAAAAATGTKAAYAPAGTCLVTGLSYPALPYGRHFSLYGDGQNLTRIKLLPGAQTPALTIGSPAATNFTAGIAIRGIAFDANGQNQPAVVSYDLVRSRFQDVLFTGGSVGYVSYGGIGNVIEADSRGNAVGARFTKFASQAGGGWPNLIRWAGAITDNATLALDIDYGRSITCSECNIEGNGTTPGADGQGGVVIGANMGTEVAKVSETVGFVCRGCWFESNRGAADLTAASGANVIEASAFSSTSPQVTYGMHFTGGIYTVIGSTGTYLMTTLKDEPGVKSGYVIGGYLPGLDVSRANLVQTFLNTNLSTALNAGGGAQVTGGTFRTAVHTETGGATPTVTFCGGAPSIAGTDTAGTVGVGSGNPGGCTVVFANVYVNPPVCTVSNRSAAPMTYTVAADRITVTTSNPAAFGASGFDYACVGR